MKKGLLAMIALALLLGLCACAEGEETAETDAWTVMIYMCGSDLESRHSCATGNLEEIARVRTPQNEFREMVSQAPDLAEAMSYSPGKVNVLIETGGARAWHTYALGMNSRTNALQIWRYNMATDTETGTFTLEEKLPLASMAQPDTLSDFIRWGTAHYPAEKYGLVLWGHGGGSATGIFIDELFNNEYMTLDLLNLALSDGGTHFEAVLFDACMMANIETACAIQEYANWMIASEEMVAGKGTAIGDWLQQLVCLPAADGRLLGRWICDTAMIKYGNSSDRQSQELITWSVIDLSRIKQLEKCFDSFFESVGILYSRFPNLLLHFASGVNFTETFGTENENMFDLATVLYTDSYRTMANVDRQKEMQDALADAVPYSVRGAGRTGARGLSFCYAMNFFSDKLDVYARNCPSPHYLALLDAISPWEAPDWVYAQVDKMPELLENGIYHVTVDKRVWKNGSPAFVILEGNEFISTVQYTLLKIDEATGRKVRLGEVPVYYDPDEEMYRVYDLTKWPSIDGSLCEIELQNLITVGNYNILYNIPMMVDSELMNMRCVYWFDTAEWEVLGLWEGYDNDSSQFNRNVMSLSKVAGREYNLLYKVTGDKRASKPYVLSPTMILYRSMKLEEITLPPGTYYIEFSIFDVFMRPMRMETVELKLDGDTVTIQGDSWEGSETLYVSTYYEGEK